MACFSQDSNAKTSYIHIPLKPPEGQIDEFSYLEFADEKTEDTTATKKLLGESEKTDIEIVAYEIIKSESIDFGNASKNGLQQGNHYLFIHEVGNTENKKGVIMFTPPTNETEINRLDSKKKMLSSSQLKHNGTGIEPESVEPENERKLSTESTRTKTSLSKQEIFKKLKDAKEHFKFLKLHMSKSETKQTKPTNTSPKYIHIPLKPPPGQTDEFSYLEFADKPEHTTNTNKNTTNRTIDTFLDKIMNNNDNLDEIVAFEIIKSESVYFEDAFQNSFQRQNNYFIIQEDDDGNHERTMIIITPPTKGTEINKLDSIRKTSSQKSSKHNNRLVKTQFTELETRRKLSTESGHSKTSLSKLGIIKKIKNATEKLKFPKLSLSMNSKKDSKKKTESTSTGPQYIHIPLKPPQGQTDEFSHLEVNEQSDNEVTTL